LRNPPNESYSCEDIKGDEFGESEMQFDVEHFVIIFAITELNNITQKNITKNVRAASRVR
jgi:hypothetical protein